MPRTAFTARHATSRTRPRTSTGSLLKAAEAPITRTCKLLSAPVLLGAVLAALPAAASATSALDDVGLAYVQARAAEMAGDHTRSAALLAALVQAQPGNEDLARKAISEAIGAGRMDLALRLARGHTRKSKIVRFVGHFHGWHDEVSAGGMSHFDGSAPPGIPASAVGETILLPADSPGPVIDALQSRTDIAAVLIEPSGARQPAAAHDQARVVAGLVAHSAAALGLRHGPVHAECRVHEHGVVILGLRPWPIESSAAATLQFATRDGVEPARDDISLAELLLRHAASETLDAYGRVVE